MLSLVHCSLLLAGASLVMGSAWYQRGGPGTSTKSPRAQKVTFSKPDPGEMALEGAWPNPWWRHQLGLRHCLNVFGIFAMSRGWQNFTVSPLVQQKSPLSRKVAGEECQQGSSHLNII